MGPTRRTKPGTYPPTPPSADDEDYQDYSTAATSQSTRTYPYPRPHASSMSTTTPLQRGSACLSCRKRKMKCDGSRPVCQQCSRANRAADCEYDDGKTKTRTQILQEKIQRLESRIHELEGNPSTSNDEGITLHKRRSNTFPPQQGFDYPIVVDSQSRSSLAFDFGTAASTSATLGYDQVQLRQVIDAASGANSGGDLSQWDDLAVHSIPAEATEWQQDDISPRLRQSLLEMVLPHLPRLGLDIHPQAFLQSLNLPPTHAMRPHPSLLNALYLHACALSPPDHYLHSHQPRFLKGARDAINASLQFSDRILDTIKAQCLLSIWYLRMGRTLEGYTTISATARFAVGCELNKIVSPVFQVQQSPDITAQDLRQSALHQTGLGVGLPTLAATAAAASTSASSGPLLDREGNLDVFQSIFAGNLTHPRNISLGFGTGLLPPSSFAHNALQSPAPGSTLALANASFHMTAGHGRHPAAQSKINPILEVPRNARDLGERILLFWRIFNLDRFWSVVCGLQPSLSEDEIMTVWPRSMDDYETGNVNDNEYASVRSLGVRQPPNAANMRPDSTMTMLSKSITLFERSARLAASLSSVQPPTDAFWVAFRLMEDSIQQMAVSIPPYKRRAGTSTMDAMMGQGTTSLSHPGSHRPSPTGSATGESPGTSSQNIYMTSQHGLGPSQSPMPGQTSFSTSASSSSRGVEIDDTLVLIHILLKTAAVQLHNIFAKEDTNSYQKAFQAARAGAGIIAEVAEVMHDPGDCDIMLGPCLTLIADVLIREAIHGGANIMESIEPELEAVLFVLKAMGANSPLISREAALVSAARDAISAQQNQDQHQHQHQAAQQVSLMGIPQPAMMPFGTGAV